MRAWRVFLIPVLGIALLLTTAVSVQADGPDAPEKPELRQDDGAGGGGAGGVGGKAVDGTWSERLKQAEHTVTLKEQERKATSEQYYQMARKYFDAMKYEQARLMVNQALTLNADHEQAKLLQHRVATALGAGRPGNKGEEFQHAVNEAAVKVQEAVAETENLFSKSRLQVDNHEYDQAIDNLELLLEIVKWFPYHVELESRRKEAEDLLASAKELRAIEQRRVFREAQDRSRFDARTAELRQKREERERVERLFEQAQLAFEKQRYEKAAQLCTKILWIDPSILPARDLRRIAHRAAYDRNLEKYRLGFAEQWKRVMEQVRMRAIVMSDVVEFPDNDTWRKIGARGASTIHDLSEDTDPKEDEIRHALATIKVELNFDSLPLPDVVDFLRDYTGLNFIIDENNVDSAEDVEVTLNVKDLVLESALKLILLRRDLIYVIEEGVVIITTEERLVAQSLLEIYDVQDLTGKIVDFPGVDISLDPSEAAGIQLGGFGDDEGSGIGGEELADLIRENLDRDSWDQGDNSVEFQNGLLIARNSKSVHRKISQFLGDVRGSTGILVQVNTRFLRVQETFIEQLGFNYTDLAAARGGLLNLPNINPPDGSTFFSGTSAGIAQPSGGTTVQRAYGTRIEHNIQGDGLFQNYLGRVANAQGWSLDGGFSAGYSLLDDISVEALIRAVSKTERSTDLTSPRVTLHNTQRGNILISNQMAYIRDIDAQVTTGVQAPQPVVDVVQDGISLDVRPIVSADRRYITMELRPTVARLVPPPPGINNFQTVIGAGITVTIEIPILQVERVRTTVTMPDRGTLLIGGLTTYQDEDIRSGIPFLEHLPIVGMLFREDIKANLRRQLLVLLRGRIIILEEEENKRF